LRVEAPAMMTVSDGQLEPLLSEELPFRFQNAAEARAYVETHAVPAIKLGVTDMDGILRGKYVAREKFLSALEKGLGFCDVIVGWDSNDQLYDNVAYTGWHTAYPDAPVRVLPETVRAKGYRDLKPLTPGYFGYSVLRSSVHAELSEELLSTCRAMDMALEGLHTETGPGVLEAAIGVDSALRAADKAVLFKTFTKVLAQRRGLMATFMAKWSPDWPGQSGHIHLSLQDRATGKGAFHDAAAAHSMSETMRWYVGGQ